MTDSRVEPELALKVNDGERKSESGSTPVEEFESLDAPLTPWVIMQGLLFGVINMIMALPTMYGYAAVIFQHQSYATEMTALVKIVCFSSAIHQLCFMLLSGLPFAIGQVQDAGLIFLSRMASNIANAIPLDATDDAERELQERRLVSTAVVTLGLSTAALGVCLVTIGRARLAKFVAYLPMPVIGGYLAFIGYFCLEAGLALCVSHPLAELGQWIEVFTVQHELILAVPGLVAGFVLFLVARYATNDAVLPAAMVLIPLFFYVLLYLFDTTLQEARDFGWMSQLGATATVKDVVELYDFSQVDWSLVPEQLPVWLAMVFVVAFSSCLDVAAIEMDIGRALDVNSELTTVGWSNVVSGLFGGFTGSYIFSQTIFTCRSGCRSRIVGAVVAVSEVAVVVAQVDLLAYVPLFFFAATLIFVGFDLMMEWLWDVRHKLQSIEYAVVLATFIAIQVFGLNKGLAVGVLCTAVQFLLTYASKSSVQRVDRRSMVPRNHFESALISSHYQRGSIVTLSLSGSLFFMSSLKILDEVKVVLGESQPREEDGGVGTAAMDASEHFPHHPSESEEESVEGSFPARSLSFAARRKSFVLTRNPSERTALLSADPSASDYAATHVRPQFLVLDFSRVVSVDATAVNSCFNAIARSARSSPVAQLIYAGCNQSVTTQLGNHGAFEGDHIHQFITIERALAWCEAEVLKSTIGGTTIPSPSPSSTTIASQAESPVRGLHPSQRRMSFSSQMNEVDTLLQEWLQFNPDTPPFRVAPWLFVGGAHHACNLDTLRSHNITHIINVTDNIPDFFPDHPALHYLRVSPVVEDDVEGIISIDFPSALLFAQPAIRTRGAVLIHSRFGLKLAPIVAAALLVGLREEPLDSAWEAVSKAIPSAQPDHALQRALSSWVQSAHPAQYTPAVRWLRDDEESKAMAVTESLSQYFTVVTLEPDTAFYRIGDASHEVYLLLDGSVDLLGRNGQVLLSLAPGNVFGYVDVQINRPRNATAMARAVVDAPQHQTHNKGASYGTPGAFFGHMERDRSSSSADMSDRHTHVCAAAISKQQLEAMGTVNPLVGFKFTQVILKQASIELSHMPTADA